MASVQGVVDVISPRLIEQGHYIIIRREALARLVQMDKHKPVYLGKQKMYLGGAIGCPFGSLFEVKGKDLHLVEQSAGPSTKASHSHIDSKIRDNRFLVDDGQSQRLTKDEIEALKAEGLSGEEIIGTLVENSTTFKEKTAYAQEKYLKKKQQKYLSYIMLLQPTARLLAEMYYAHGPLKICNLRIDSLAQMLTMCNIVPGGKYAVVDSSLGLVVAAVLERLGNSGCVIQLHPEEAAVSSYRQAVLALNIPKETLKNILFGISLSQAVEALSSDHAVTAEAKDVIQPKCDSDEDNKSFIKQELVDTEEMETEGDMKQQMKELERKKRKAERQREQQEAIKILTQRKLDGLLIVTKYHPLNILQSLFGCLAFSRPFAVFCSYQSPIIECYNALKSENNAVFMKMSETWLRKYQILPDRTHPDMTMSGSGGYLLTGIKVETPPH